MATLKLRPGIILQTTFDKVGMDKAYDTVYFTDGNYIINRPIKLNPGTTITGTSKAVLKLIYYASTSLFKIMTPLFGQVDNDICNVTIENITLDGNYLKQTVTHGKGYHNFIGFTDGDNIVIQNVTFQNSMGDGARLRDCTDVTFSANKVYGVGHDGLYCENCNCVNAQDNLIYTRINSGLRVRGCSNVDLGFNKILSTDKYSPRYAPGVIIENSEEGKESHGINFHDNYIEGCFGPGIWGIGKYNVNIPAASGLTIERNTIVNCGNMPAGLENVQAVGGIIISGWDLVTLKENVIRGCKGYGILFGEYVGTSDRAGNTAILESNIITDIAKSNYSEASNFKNGIPEKYSIKFAISSSNSKPPQDFIGAGYALVIVSGDKNAIESLSASLLKTGVVDPFAYKIAIYPA